MQPEVTDSTTPSTTIQPEKPSAHAYDGLVCPYCGLYRGHWRDLNVLRCAGCDAIIGYFLEAEVSHDLR